MLFGLFLLSAVHRLRAYSLNTYYVLNTIILKMMCNVPAVAIPKCSIYSPSGVRLKNIAIYFQSFQEPPVPMTSSSHLLTTLALFFILSPSIGFATDFIVGDGSGWTVGFDYAAWTKDKEFHVGDKLSKAFAQLTI